MRKSEKDCSRIKERDAEKVTEEYVLMTSVEKASRTPRPNQKETIFNLNVNKTSH